MERYVVHITDQTYMHFLESLPMMGNHLRGYRYREKITWPKLPVWQALLDDRIRDNRPAHLRTQHRWAPLGGAGSPSLDELPADRSYHVIRIPSDVGPALVKLARQHDALADAYGVRGNKDPITHLISQFLEAVSQGHLVVERTRYQ